MSTILRITRAGPLSTIQDNGREGLLAHGISASGPMDRGSHALAGDLAGAIDAAGIEMTRAGLDCVIDRGTMRVGWAGGAFGASVNGKSVQWPGSSLLQAGDLLSITPGAWGNYGYLRFGPRIDLPPQMGSLSTSTRARLGGLEGRGLCAGDVLNFVGEGQAPTIRSEQARHEAPIRFIWGIHAERFPASLRARFVSGRFRISSAMDRMGVRLKDETGVFAGASILSLVSDPILAGDIQILGDGTPIVLMRDHQPTGGYPRIGTVISVDLDRFAQMRPEESVAFEPVSVEHAQRVRRSSWT